MGRTELILIRTSALADRGPWRGWRTFPFLTAALTLAACALYLSPAAMLAVQYDTAAPLHTQPWRFLAGHWAHWSADHFAWSGVTFAVLGAACERRGRGRLVACVLAAATLIPLTLWTLQPVIHMYRGLSGIDSALFGLLTITLLRDAMRDRSGGRAAWVIATFITLLAFVAKIAIELITGAALFVNAGGAADGFAPVPLAHLAGAIVGAVVAFAGRSPPVSP